MVSIVARSFAVAIVRRYQLARRGETCGSRSEPPSPETQNAPAREAGRIHAFQNARGSRSPAVHASAGAPCIVAARTFDPESAPRAAAARRMEMQNAPGSVAGSVSGFEDAADIVAASTSARGGRRLRRSSVRRRRLRGRRGRHVEKERRHVVPLPRKPLIERALGRGERVGRFEHQPDAGAH